RLIAVDSFTDHLHVWFRTKQNAEPSPHERLVIREHDANHELLLAGRGAQTRNPPASIVPASNVPPSATPRPRRPLNPYPVPEADVARPPEVVAPSLRTSSSRPLSV